MSKRNYNPLNEGYSGKVKVIDGYKGPATQKAPATLPGLPPKKQTKLMSI
jgi:hypothetical protein